MNNVPPSHQPRHAFFYHFLQNSALAVPTTTQKLCCQHCCLLLLLAQSHSISKTFNFIIANRVDNHVKHLHGQQEADIIISSHLTFEKISLTPTQFNSVQPATCYHGEHRRRRHQHCRHCRIFLHCQMSDLSQTYEIKSEW